MMPEALSEEVVNNEPDVLAALDHYGWLAFEVAVDTYGWEHEAVWAALESWLHRERS